MLGTKTRVKEHHRDPGRPPRRQGDAIDPGQLRQVIEAALEVSSLLASAEGLKVLVTTREPLRLRGERELQVPSLALPDSQHSDPEILATSPAVALFCERAAAVKASFGLTADNAASLAEICRRLDGLPLAFELAAARIRTMSPSSLLARLDRSLEVLTGGQRDLADRQRTLRAAISWSYELLDEDEKRLFCRLGVFVGGLHPRRRRGGGRPRRTLSPDLGRPLLPRRQEPFAPHRSRALLHAGDDPQLRPRDARGVWGSRGDPSGARRQWLRHLCHTKSPTHPSTLVVGYGRETNSRSPPITASRRRAQARRRQAPVLFSP